jgi:hypothetical protein
MVDRYKLKPNFSCFGGLSDVGFTISIFKKCNFHGFFEMECWLMTTAISIETIEIDVLVS